MEINSTVTFKHNPSFKHSKRPKVLIVGAGLGGLALGMILQKSDTPYEIFERTPEVKPLGNKSIHKHTAMVITEAERRFVHMGIYDEFHALSRALSVIKVVTAPELETAFLVAGFENPIKRYGAEARTIPRPILYDLLMRQIPKERIHLGKKVLSTQQGSNGVMIRCADGSEYEGDILVGADGAYSAVRQNLYAQLKKENKLPTSDGLPLPFLNVCLVGQTRPLTLEEFPDLAKSQCQFINILAKDKPYAWMTFTTEQSTVCFGVLQYLTEETTKDDDAFMNSEWGPEAANAMCKEVKDFPIVSGGEKQLTLGNLFEWTPKDMISKVMLEEKLFKTWSHCRTVLMGDACHKLNPSGGEGGNNALQDAIVLANYIHALPDHPVAEEIEAAFDAYRKERIPWVEAAFTTSQAFRNMVDSNMKAKVMRFFMKNMPSWASGMIERRVLSNRPQVYFLSRDETACELAPAPQASLNLKRPESKRQQKKKDDDGVVAEEFAQPV